jgi:two-component system NarL family response regulator
MKPNRIRILIVDDHPSLRAGLSALIASTQDMEVTGECCNGREASEMFRIQQPDIVLMDLRMPELGGVEATLTIRAEFPDARIIVNTTYDGDEDIYRAIQSGAKSYLTKEMPKEEILGTIRDVHAGNFILPSQVEKRLRERMDRPELTKRELAVLDFLVKGRSNKEIADLLDLSEDAVKSRLKALFGKLGVQDRTGAVVCALRHGIIHLE